MKTRKHVHEETFPVAPAQLFAVLHTPSAIRQWWGAARAIVLPEPGGLWAAAWGDAEDDPLFEVVSGDYFVDANVCCQGPGLINYHVPVTITDGETEIVDLQACLVCV